MQQTTKAHPRHARQLFAFREGFDKSATRDTLCNITYSPQYLSKWTQCGAATKDIERETAIVGPTGDRRTDRSFEEVHTIIHRIAKLSRDSSAASYSSTSTVDSLPAEVPYKIAFNITSILSNSPIPRTRYARSLFAQSRPMFPAAKKVVFRAPLTEDIKTSRYTMAHSDIEISITSIPIIDTDPVKGTEGQVPAMATNLEANVDAACVAATAPHTGEKRESSDEEDSDTCPATPVAGRRKKSRVWRWTLGPVDVASKQARPDEVSIGEEVYDGTSSDT
ncbi:hypothetical protein LTR74_009682 [Friedmanniomyces endolithicus]|nr:hypothetical protein LTR74_009682 [Friedmanniomyces endolithicus]